MHNIIILHVRIIFSTKEIVKQNSNFITRVSIIYRCHGIKSLLMADENYRVFFSMTLLRRISGNMTISSTPGKPT